MVVLRLGVVLTGEIEAPALKGEDVDEWGVLAALVAARLA